MFGRNRIDSHILNLSQQLVLPTHIFHVLSSPFMKMSTVFEIKQVLKTCRFYVNDHPWDLLILSTFGKS